MIVTEAGQHFVKELKFFRFGDSIEQGLFELISTLLSYHLTARQFHTAKLLLSRILNGMKQALFARRYKQDCCTTATSATGTADTVHIGLGIVGNIVVQNMANAYNVDTTSGYISGNNNIEFAIFQALNSAFAQLLIHVAIQSGGGIASCF